MQGFGFHGGTIICRPDQIETHLTRLRQRGVNPIKYKTLSGGKVQISYGNMAAPSHPDITHKDWLDHMVECISENRPYMTYAQFKDAQAGVTVTADG